MGVFCIEKEEERCAENVKATSGERLVPEQMHLEHYK